MPNTKTATGIIEESNLLDQWEGEDIEDTLNALRPYLLYRQTIARRDSHRISLDVLLPTFRHINEEMSKILSIPQNQKTNG